VIAMLILAASAAACMRVQARTPAAEPGLNTPPAPAPIVTPVVLEPPAPEPEPTPVTSTTNPARDPVTPPARPPRPAPATPPPPVTAPPAEPTPPPPTLQTTPDASATENRTNATLNTAEQNLNRVVRDRLGPEARAQYDNAVGLIRMSKNYLKLKNYMYAEQLADKAAAVALLLIKY